MTSLYSSAVSVSTATPLTSTLPLAVSTQSEVVSVAPGARRAPGQTPPAGGRRAAGSAFDALEDVTAQQVVDHGRVGYMVGQVERGQLMLFGGCAFVPDLATLAGEIFVPAQRRDQIALKLPAIGRRGCVGRRLLQRRLQEAADAVHHARVAARSIERQSRYRRR
jgi:hypothetical protein